jgi:hypothetical protein
MTDGRDVPKKDEGRPGHDWGPLDEGFIGCVRLRSARVNSSCSLKLRGARGDGVNVLRSRLDGVERGISRVLAWSGGHLVCFDAWGDPRINVRLTIPYISARTDVSTGSMSHSPVGMGS